MRVHILAKELDVPSKVIIEKCKAEGIDTVKNHMSTLSAGLHATILEWFSEGTHTTTLETSSRVDLKKVQKKRPKKVAAKAKADSGDGEAEGSGGVAVAEAPPSMIKASQVSDSDALVQDLPSSDIAENIPAVTVEGSVAEPTDLEIDQSAQNVTSGAVAEAPSDTTETPPVDLPDQLTSTPEEEPTTKRNPIVPAGPQNVPAKAKLQGPRVVRYEAPDYDTLRSRPAPRPSPGGEGGSTTETGKTDKTSRRKGRVNPRRTTGRTGDGGQRVSEWRDRDLAERKERLAGATGRRIRRRASSSSYSPVAHVQKTEAKVNEPVRMKEFCSATGLNFMECFKILRDEHKMHANVNMTLPTDVAQLLALHFGIELEVVPSKTKLDELQEEVAARQRNHLEPRPPVVTMLGHVDHGKTSLLDAIRKTQVVAGEDGGITQHIGAYHVDSGHGHVTFLDTPGHQAFTAMRARGAQLTDVVVLVVAADDGLMPQTIEAINHAKSAEVSIVVALNKIDLGDQNKVKIFTQLSERELTPSGDWGGEIDVIETSATTGLGIQELVDHLADLNSLLELKADPTLPAVGAVIEAETKPGVGAVVRVLIQEGTLRVGDFVTCGPASGKVRALLDDRGNRIKQAGPSIPVEVWGLDGVPQSGDKLYVVENMQRAKDIATEIKRQRIDSSRVQSRKMRTLEEMVQRRDSDEVPELNIIIKADVDGSVVALRQSLGEIPSEEVRLSIRHSGVGAVNDSDVHLAAACNGIIISFRVETPVGVRKLTEKYSVDVRSYRVIYDACDDVKKALEGLLEPDRLIEYRGSAEVREMFRFGKKIGIIAGCFVKDGLINRNHFAKVIRNDVVVREKCRLSSLRRFKDDVKEVRSGLECGIKLEGFTDIHAGDIIETYEIIEVARTL